MAILWHLKTYVARKHNPTKSTELQALIIKKTNVRISLQNICNLMNAKPLSLKLSTIEILCTALDCKLSDFCEVKQGNVACEKQRKLSFQNTPNGKRVKADFPDPIDYEEK